MQLVDPEPDPTRPPLWTVATPRTSRVLFVASTGGHLAELVQFAKTLDLHPDSLWVTFDSEQSRSLLLGCRSLFVPYVSPRGYTAVLRTLLIVTGRLRAQKFDLCISTGAAVALGVLPWARLRGIPRVYIESVARTDGPSVTGRVVRSLGLATTFTQHAAWADARWRRHRSVLSGHASVPRARPSGRLKIFVSLGTIRPYRFDSVVDALLGLGVVDDDTVWQLGATMGRALPGHVHEVVAATQFAEFCRSADVVVTHAGVGNIMTMLDMGLHPVVVPRRQHRGEHVDDHQMQICRLLREVGIGRVCDAGMLTEEDLWAASERRTVTP